MDPLVKFCVIQVAAYPRLYSTGAGRLHYLQHRFQIAVSLCHR